ncbi:hypothetical protein Bca4012_022037 [Brassica carinata]
MALMVNAVPLLFRPPPDPPPYEYPLFEVLSPVAPPEPPDPPDALLALLRIVVTYAKPSLQAVTQTLDLKLPCSTMVTKLCGGGVPLVSSSDSSFAYGCLFPVVCRSFPCRFVEWSIPKSRPDLPSHPPVTVLQVHHSSSLSAYPYSVEWVEKRVVCVTLNLWSVVLMVNVLMERASFGSTFVPFSGINVVSVRSLTAVCSPLIISSLVRSAVILCFSSLWQLEGKLVDICCLLNMILIGIVLPIVFCLELCLFPIFSLVWSKMEDQVWLVLKESSSQLMLSSAVDAVLVTLWVTFVYPFGWLFVALLYPPLMEFKLF